MWIILKYYIMGSGSYIFFGIIYYYYYYYYYIIDTLTTLYRQPS
jgi:hypothetical protein